MYAPLWPRGPAEAVDATAEQLPFPDGAFDAAMTTFSVHRWSDPGAGIVDALGGTVTQSRGHGCARPVRRRKPCPPLEARPPWLGRPA
ncbi:methyltransferase domain-containing protein [Streptomyces galilaeus]